MKILFFTDNFYPERNAAATRVYERALYWVKAGHEVTVITCAPNFPDGKVFEGYKNKWFQSEDIKGIRVIRVKTFIAPNVGFGLRVLDFLSYMVASFFAGLFQSKKNFDIVVSTSPQFFAAVSAWAVAKIKSVPYIFELGDLWPESIKAVGLMKDSWSLKLMERLELFLYHQSSKVVALTHAFKENLISRGVPTTQVEVVLNGVELDIYSPRPKHKMLIEKHHLNDKFVVGYIGTLGMAHGLKNVLYAAKILMNEAPHIHFLMVGSGADKSYLLDLSKNLRLRNISFIEPQPKERMPDFWSLCDLSLIHLKNSPVFSTVIPSKLFESMGMGLPVLLVAPSGEASKIVKEHRVGLHIKPGDPQLLAETLKNMGTDQVSLKQYAANSYASARDFTRKEQADKFLKILEQVKNVPMKLHGDMVEPQNTYLNK